MTTHLAMSRTFPVGVEHAYDVVLHSPLTDIFSRRYAVIAPISKVTGQQGAWGTAVGESRTITLADGGTMLETLTGIDAPRSFGYSMTSITGKMKPLVASAIGTWAFEPDGTGTRITWTWDVTPAPLGRIAMPVFGRLWSGYADRGFDQLGRLLTR